MTLLDSSGEIRVTAFDEIVEKFYEQLEIDKVYHLENGQIRLSNKLYNTTNHECEIYSSKESILKQCKKTTKTIPMIQYNLKSIAEIKKTGKNETIDTIGICSRNRRI